MQFDKFTIKSQEAIQIAQAMAQKARHSEVAIEHVVLALLQQEEGMVPSLLSKVGVTPSQIEGEVKDLLAKLFHIFPNLFIFFNRFF